MRKIWLVLLLLVVPTFSVLLRPGFFPLQDHMQAFRIFQMSKCFQDGQLPCRWVPDLGQGYGYPLFIYYAPGPYYVGALLSFAFQYVGAVKVLFVLGFVVSALGMYLLSKEVYANKYSALASTLLYLYLPFRAVQVYVRGSLGEFLALALFPFVFLFYCRLGKFGKKRDFLFSALSLSALVLTHNLMSYLFIPLLGLWIMLSARREYLPQIIFSLFLAFGLSAFFIVPLVFERQLVHLETMVGGYFGYQQHFVSLYRLFVSNAWGYGSSGVDDPSALNLSVGQAHWLLAVGAIAFAAAKRNKTILVLGLAEICVLFLMHVKSSFLWAAIPPLSYLQFPWRLLAISGFILSFISGSIVRRKEVVIILFVILVLAYGKFFRPSVWQSDYTDAVLFSPSQYAAELTTSIYDYLPKTASKAPAEASSRYPSFISGQGAIIHYQVSSSSQSGEIDVFVPSVVQLPIYSFLGNQVKVDGEIVKYGHSTTGQIEIALNPGKHLLLVQVISTSDRKAGDIISVASLFVLGILALI